MKVTIELDERQAEALRLIARKEGRPVIEYFRTALFFLLRDRADRDPEVRSVLERVLSSGPKPARASSHRRKPRVTVRAAATS